MINSLIQNPSKHLPARKVKNNRVKNTGFVYSKKNNRLVNYESMLERAVFFLLDYAEDVSCYFEQPLVIQYTHNNRRKKYYPDVLSISKDSSGQLIEIKPSDKLEDPEVKIKNNAMKEFGEDNNLFTRIITEKDLPSRSFLINVELLAYYGNRKPNNTDDLVKQILNYVDKKECVSISEILSVNISERTLVLRCIYYLLYSKYLITHMDDGIIKLDSLLKSSGKEAEHA